MHDLNGAYQRIDNLYRMYVKSAFPMRSEILNDERDLLLHDGPYLSQPPLLEPSPVYPSSGLDLDNAIAGLPKDYQGLEQLAKGLFPSGRELYQHQWESLQQVIQNGQDIVVTTGTGSGKTECFLLPLLGQLTKESLMWPSIVPEPDNHQWWAKDPNERVGQWGHSDRTHAMRAVVLYPLNALVEDQLMRLRMVLDNDDTHSWLDAHRGRNRITFGRYTRQTPVSGHKTKANIKALSEKLIMSNYTYDEVLNELANNPDLPPETRYFFPRLDGGEMWSRWDMQETPPDIMITNYSMLNIMMMRSIEDDMFAKTRAWLSEDGHPERQFSLVVDELHSYRGTAGTEVAYIIRLLLERLGLDLDSPKLRILSTSASLSDDESGRKFLRQFFGRDDSSFHIINAPQILPPSSAETLALPYQEAFSSFAKAVQPDPLQETPDPTQAQVRLEMGTLAQKLGRVSTRGEKEENALASALIATGMPGAIRAACRSLAVNDEVRPAKVTDLDSVLFPGIGPSLDNPTSDAMRGLLLGLGMSSDAKDSRPPLIVRGHLFFKNLQSIWACSDPTCSKVADERALLRSGTGWLPPTVGALHLSHKVICGKDCGSRVLDLIVCEMCGEVLLGGYKSTIGTGGNIFCLTPDEGDLEGIPDATVNEKDFEHYSVFWPVTTRDGLRLDEPVGNNGTGYRWHDVSRQWIHARLDKSNGILRRDNSPPKENDVAGWVYDIKGAKAAQEPAMPPKCPRCDVDYRRRDLVSPLREHRTGFQRVAQVLAGGAFRELSASSDTEANNKMVLFSDSRSDAAKLSAGMERDHFRDMARTILFRSAEEYWHLLEGFLRVISTKMAQILPMLEGINEELFRVVSEGSDPRDQIWHQKFNQTQGAIAGEAVQWGIGLPPNQPARDAWTDMLRSYPREIPIKLLVELISREILSYGMCPGGSDASAKGFPYPRYDHPWYECFDFGQSPPGLLIAPSDEQRAHIATMQVMLKREVIDVLFSHRTRNVETLGKGWVTYRKEENHDPVLARACEVVIRDLATRGQHCFSKYFNRKQDQVPSINLPRIFRGQNGYLARIGIEESTVQDELISSGTAMEGPGGMSLNPDRLYYRARQSSDDNPSSSSEGFMCNECHSFYLNNVQFCPYCPEKPPMTPSQIPTAPDYYNKLSEPESEVFRMNAEELTGQTDESDKPVRQRWFQEIFVRSQGEYGLPCGLDLLSVTTTMEAGVDIGSLNAVMMSNMPPRRFNYQQRVGRAGRRGSAVSLAVTLCRDRSHDEYYYQRPEKITGDPPPPPYIDMDSKEILTRVVTKEVLRLSLIGQDTGGKDNVHGEFGATSDWTANKAAVMSWVGDQVNTDHILHVIDLLDSGSDRNHSEKVALRNELLDYTRKGLIENVDKAVYEKGEEHGALSELLARRGLLPMFGFPTRVRLLHTNLPNSRTLISGRGAIDRNLDIAISQFAPESQTVKDKMIHRAVGFVQWVPAGNVLATRDSFDPPLPGGNPNPIGICSFCKSVIEISPMVEAAVGGKIPEKQECPICHAEEPSLMPCDAREPKNFMTDLRPEPYDGSFEWRPRSTRPSMTPNIVFPLVESKLGNGKATAVFDDIHSINDNGGQGGFDLSEAKIIGKDRPGTYALSGTNTSGVVASGPAYRVALRSSRRTDIMLVGIDDWPTGVGADPTTIEGRAAWSSLAFSLREAAGKDLDIDSRELESGYRLRLEGTDIIGEAFISDSLDNGAGYCKELARPDQIRSLLDKLDPTNPESIAWNWANEQVSGHSAECATSCHECLLDFFNRPYHAILDWRLALDMAYMVTNKDGVLRLSPGEGTPDYWSQLVYGDSSPVKTTLEGLNYSPYPGDFNGLPGYTREVGDIKKLVIIRHPLWNDSHPIWVEAKSEAIGRFPGHEISDANPFMLLRKVAIYV